MNAVMRAAPSAAPWRQRVLRFPLVRRAIALLYIALRFAAVAIPFNMFVVDRSLKKAGALLLAAIILIAYSAYVRVVEKREVTELSTQHAPRELAAGLFIGSLLLSLTIGVLAVLGMYRVTGIDAACIMLVGGVMLAAAHMLTRRLWLCIGIHFARNFTQGGIFSAAVSGMKTTGFFQAQMTGPAWLTGRAFGAEASLAVWLQCTVAGILLRMAAARRNQIVQPFWSAGLLQGQAA
jgi:hypothetical protein